MTTEKFQIIIETLGGAGATTEFRKVGAAAEAEYAKVSTHSLKAGADVDAAQKKMASSTEASQAKMAAASAKTDAAQVKSAASAGNVEKAQAKLATTATKTATETEKAAKSTTLLGTAHKEAAAGAGVSEAAHAKLAKATGTATSETAKLEGAAKKAGGEVKSLGTVAQDGLKGLTGQLGSLGGGVGALSGGLNGLTAKLGEAKGAMAGMGGEGSTLKSVLTGVGVGAAAVTVGLAGLAVDGLSKLAAGTAEVRKLKAALGSTAEDASKLRNVAGALGIGTDDLTKGLFKLSVNLDKTKGNLAGVHVETVRNKDGSADLVKTLDNVRAAYQSIEDPQKKNEFLMQAMSKAGLNLRGVMSLTNKEFEIFKNRGPVYNQKDLDDSLALSRAQSELKQAFEKLEVGLAKGLVPVLTDVSKGFTAVVNAAEKLHIPLPKIVEIGVVSLVAAAAVSKLGTAFAAEAVEAGAAATATAGAAVSTAAAGATAGAAAGKIASSAAGAGGAAAVATGKLEILSGATLASAGNLGFLAVAITDLEPIIGFKLGQSVAKSAGAHGQLGDQIVKLERHIPLVGGFLADLDAKHQKAAKSTKDTADATGKLGGNAGDAEPKVGLLATNVSLLEKALDPAPHDLTITGSAASTMATSFDKAKEAVAGLTTKLDALLTPAVTIDEKTIAYEQSLSELTTKLTENGKTLDLTTQKGRDNQGAIDAVVSSMKGHIEALINTGATQDEVRGAFNRHIEDFRRVLTQMGYNKGEIAELIIKYGLIPKTVDTAVALVGAKQAEADAQSLVDHLVEKFRIAQDAAKISVTVFGADKAESTLAAIKADSGDISKITNGPRDVSTPDGVGGAPPTGPEDRSAIGNILGSKGIVPLKAGGRTNGFVTKGPSFLVGEGNPSFPEVVIPTDPAYRGRAEKLTEYALTKINHVNSKKLAGGGVAGAGEVESYQAAASYGFGMPVDQDTFVRNASNDPHEGAAGWIEDLDGHWIPQGSATRFPRSSGPGRRAERPVRPLGKAGSLGGSSGAGSINGGSDPAFIRDLAAAIAACLSALPPATIMLDGRAVGESRSVVEGVSKGMFESQRARL